MNDTISSNPQRKPGWGRRIFRLLFRISRVTLVIGLIIAAVLVWYVHEIGLPEMVKVRVLAKMRANGWELEFSRVRLQGWEQFVAEDVQLSRSGTTRGPELLVRKLHIHGKFYHDKGWHYKLRSVSLDDGTMLATVTNGHARYILLNGLGGEVKFHDNDRWELSSLQGIFGNINFHISGDLDHASEIAKGRPAAKPATPRELSFNEALDFLKKLQLGGSPELVARFQADARDLKTTDARLTFKLPRLASKWCGMTNLELQVQTIPAPESNRPFTAQIQIKSAGSETQWGQALNAKVDLNLQFSSAWKLTNTTVVAEASNLRTPWATTAVVRAQTALPLSTNSEERLSTKVAVKAHEVSTQWGRARQTELETAVSLPRLAKLFSTNTAWAERLQLMVLTNTLTVNNLTSTWFASDQIRLDTDWQWPQVQAQVSGGIQGGAVTAAAAFNVTNRTLIFRSATDLDLQPFLPRVLSTNLQRALAENYSGSTSPKLQLQGQTVLPPWTNRPFWTPQLTNLSVAGHFDLGSGSCRKVSFNGLASSFALTNRVLQLTGLTLTRPEGVLRAEFQNDFKDQSFSWVLSSDIDPKVARNFFSNPKDQEIFDQLVFTVPPFVKAEISGAWNNPQTISFRAQTRITNFTFRGETLQSFTGGLQYSNNFLTFIEPVLVRPEGQGTASNVVIDFSSELLYLTNAESTLDPFVIARAIGTHVVKTLQPYQFGVPPHGTINGIVDLKRHSTRDDLHFKIQGSDFRWGQLRLQKVSSQIDWVGDSLTFSNLQGDFITGRLDGQVHLDLSPQVGATFSAQANVVEADLREFLSNWSTNTAHLEGRLNGQLNLTNGNTELPLTWQGFGWLSLRDGLLWDIPMFGLFSPALNAMAPGLGNSRARKASATFVITNRVVASSDLEIHATAMRMQFEGTVDFEQNLKARVEAELLRDIPAVGLVMSKVLWPVTKLFEYKVTGTLGKPKSEPLYIIPKVLLTPLQALKSFKDLFKPPEPGREEK